MSAPVFLSWSQVLPSAAEREMLADLLGARNAAANAAKEFYKQIYAIHENRETKEALSSIENTKELGEILDRAAAALYQAFIEQDIGLKCSYEFQKLGGDDYCVIRIRVPSDVERPHRVYREAIDRVHERVREVSESLSGRVGFIFDRGQDAA